MLNDFNQFSISALQFENVSGTFIKIKRPEDRL